MIFLWVRSDQGQQYILKRTTAYLSSKTNTTIKIDYLYLSWVGDLVAKGIYLEDLQQDTLVYAEHVNVNLDLWSLIRKKTIDIEYIIGRDVRLNVDRSSVSGEFNYQFIMDAFTSSDSGKSKSIPLSFQKISMDKIRIASNDAIQGINYLVKLEDLDLEMKKMNISKREYEVDLLSLNDGAFIYNKYGTKSEVDEINVPDNSINHIAINQAEIINIAADYTSAVDGLEIKSFLPQSLFESINISPEDNYISAQSVILSSGELNYHDMNSNSSDKSGLLTQSDSSIGLDWKLDIDNLKLIENNLAFRRGDAVGVKGIFNPNDVILQELNLDSRKLFISKSEGSGQLLSLSVKERSGFNISNLTSDVEFDNDNLAIQNLQIKTGHNRLKGEVHIFYKSLNEFMSNPELVQFDVNFPDVLLNPKDVFYFNPDWRKNPKISKLVENNIKGNVYVKGFFNEMEVINSNLSWGRFDKVGVSGFVSNITSKKSPIQFDLDKVNVKMTRSTVMHLLDTDSLKFNLPKDILLDGKIKGNIDHIFSDIRLVSNEGTIGFKGELGYQNNNITIDGHADFDNVNLKHFLDNEQLGIVSGSGEISMQGSELYNLVANISANIDEIDFHDYRYNHIRLDTEL
ncbi:MAG: hypothetical protein KJP00_02805, partial [Bacteroidia bacterium]|nr:hypothetical protein [Bacteroidia bacterium]